MGVPFSAPVADVYHLRELREEALNGLRSVLQQPDSAWMVPPRAVAFDGAGIAPSLTAAELLGTLADASPERRLLEVLSTAVGEVDIADGMPQPLGCSGDFVNDVLTAALVPPLPRRPTGAVYAQPTAVAAIAIPRLAALHVAVQPGSLPRDQPLDGIRWRALAAAIHGASRPRPADAMDAGPADGD